jgi:hypothetical protein
MIQFHAYYRRLLSNFVLFMERICYDIAKRKTNFIPEKSYINMYILRDQE